MRRVTRPITFSARVPLEVRQRTLAGVDALADATLRLAYINFDLGQGATPAALQALRASLGLRRQRAVGCMPKPCEAEIAPAS